MIKFHFLTGDINWLQYGGKWISQKLNNGDFDFWMILDFINYEDATGERLEDGSKYVTELRAVAPSEISPEQLKSAFESCGWDNHGQPFSDEAICEIVDSYGITAMLYSQSGNNAHKLIREVKHEAQLVNMLFGFYMDRSENRIGQSGWDLIRGQDIREFFDIHYPKS